MLSAAVHGDYDAALTALGEKLKGLVYVGAQAMAQVVHDDAKVLAPSSAKEHYFYGTQHKKTGVKYLFQPGTLRNSIYQVNSKDKSPPGRATYQVAWNHTKCPYGFMVEFGTSRAAAHPFLYPAFSMNKGRLAQIANAAMKAKL